MNRLAWIKSWRILSWLSTGAPGAVLSTRLLQCEAQTDMCTVTEQTGADVEQTKNDFLMCIHINDAFSFGMLVTDADGDSVYSNAAYQRLTGRSAKTLKGSHWSTHIHPDDRQEAIEHWRGSMSGESACVGEARLLRTGKQILWVHFSMVAFNEPAESSPVRGYLLTVVNISAAKLKDKQRQTKENFLMNEQIRSHLTLDSIGDAVISTDTQGNVAYMNIVAENMTGWPREQALGKPLTQVFCILDVTTHLPVSNPAQGLLAENPPRDSISTAVLLGRNGIEMAIENSAKVIRDDSGSVSGAVMVFHDLMFSRTVAKKMTHMALHDHLTGLPNRAALSERFAHALALARRHQKKVGLLFIDLDNFKQVNDDLGHERGDLLLVALAAQLLESVRGTDTVCRYGGDEFVVLLSEIDQREHAMHIAGKIHELAAVPIAIGDRKLALSLSIGISVYPDDGENMATLLNRADIAMYKEKQCLEKRRMKKSRRAELFEPDSGRQPHSPSHSHSYSHPHPHPVRPC